MADGPGEARWVDAAEGWYRLLLAVAFPRSFRAAVGQDAARAFRDGARHAYRTGGPARLVGACAAAAPRVLREGLAERWDALARNNRKSGELARPRRLGGVEMMVTDLRHAARALRNNPRFTLAIVLTFALGVGVNTAVFSFVRGVLLRPLPMAGAEGIVLLGYKEDGGLPTSVTSPPAVRAVVEEVEALEGVAAFAWTGGVLRGHGDPVRVVGAQVGPGYFATLGQPPMLGREFTAEESGRAAPPVIIISHGLWRSRFGGATDVLGRTIEYDGSPREIIGVAAAGLVAPHAMAFGDAGDVFVPMFWNAEDHHLGYRVVRAVARLAPGATLAEAGAELDALATGLTEANPDYGTQTLGVMPLREYFVAGGRNVLLILQGAVLLVLLIGAVNVMNLALARGVERRRDLAVRAALGAGRGALVRAVLLEVVLAGAVGGGLGVLLALALIPAILATAPASLPALAWVRVDGATVLGAAAFTFGAALLAGLVPALRLLGARTVAGLTRDGMRSTAGASHRRLQGTLAAAQVALAVALLVGAGLLLRSFAGLMAVDLGYEPAGVRILQVDLDPARHPSPAAWEGFLDGLAERLAARPEVAAASYGSTAPQHGLNNFTTGIGVVGWEERNGGQNPWAYVRAVAPGYLATLGLDVVAGRGLTAADHRVTVYADSLDLRAAMVNVEFARAFLPDGALGRRVVLWNDTMEVVGVVEPMRYANPSLPPEPEIYAPFDGRLNAALIVVRGSGSDAGLAQALREVARAADASLPVDRIPALTELLAESVAATRTVMVLLLGMAALALGIAAVGIYGVLSFLVARRRTEIGVRMALGAGAGDVLTMLLLQGGRIVAWGLVAGLALAWATGQVLAGLLFGVGPRDPGVFVAVAVTLGLVAVTASWLPAVRAARTDPMRTLREG